MVLVLDKRYFDDPTADLSDGGLGDWWNAVGQIGAAGVQLLPSLLGGGGGSAGGPARGLAAIQAAVDQALGSLRTLLSQARSGQMPVAQALAEAQRIAGALSNGQYVYQAQRGNDAEALRNGKTQAAAIVAQIQALGSGLPVGGQAGTQPPVSVPAGGNTVGTPPASSVPSAGSGIDSNTLLIVGGGLAVLLLLRS